MQGLASQWRADINTNAKQSRRCLDEATVDARTVPSTFPPPFTVCHPACVEFNLPLPLLMLWLLVQLSSCVGGSAAAVAECSSADGIADDPFEPGQAVGVGIKAEMWKTKHPNLTVLETGEDTPVLVRLVLFLV